MTTPLPVNGVVFSVNFLDASGTSIFSFSNQLTVTSHFNGPIVGEGFEFADQPAGKTYIGQVSSVFKTMGNDGSSLALFMNVVCSDSTERPWP